MARVKLQTLSKSYGDTEVVCGVDLEIDDGEFLVLVGESGCGKSTLLRMLAGLETPTSGEILIGDTVVNDLRPRERDIAMVFQSYALYPHMTVAENMGFGLRVRGQSKEQINKAVTETAELLDIGHLLHRKPKELSGGQRQRVAMGRSLVRRPRVFLFDEPLSNLDAALRSRMRVELKSQHQRLGVTTVYVTHDQLEAMTLADRIALMHKGVFQQVGPPRELYNWPQNKFTASFLGSPGMNFVDAELDGALCRGPGIELEVNQSLLVRPDYRGPVVLGVRPHDLHSASAEETRPGVTAKIRALELMGWETQVHLDLSGHEWVARFDATTAVDLEVGQELRLNVTPDDIRLFEPEGGAALCRPGEPT